MGTATAVSDREHCIEWPRRYRTVSRCACYLWRVCE